VQNFVHKLNLVSSLCNISFPKYNGFNSISLHISFGSESYFESICGIKKWEGMAESIIISGTTKESSYQELLPQIAALLEGEPDLVANLANTASALHMAFGWHWVGFYLVKNDVLVLGPFQGPIACTRIGFGKGVCGKAWKQKETILVPDVNQFEGHIACSAQSQSEIVVPILANNAVVAVLDVDSLYLNDFNETDQQFLEQLAEMLSHCF